jgi:hypothetical protein
MGLATQAKEMPMSLLIAQLTRNRLLAALIRPSAPCAHNQPRIDVVPTRRATFRIDQKLSESS